MLWYSETIQPGNVWKRFKNNHGPAFWSFYNSIVLFLLSTINTTLGWHVKIEQSLILQVGGIIITENSISLQLVCFFSFLIYCCATVSQTLRLKQVAFSSQLNSEEFPLCSFLESLIRVCLWYCRILDRTKTKYRLLHIFQAQIWLNYFDQNLSKLNYQFRKVHDVGF